MIITIIGSGYVGLTLGTCLASHHKVTLIDLDRQKIEMINKGRIPFFEEGLEKLLREALQEHRIKAVAVPKTLETDIVFFCVGTPNDQDGYINLKTLKLAFQTLIDILRHSPPKEYLLLVIKSTVIPGTTRKLCTRLIKDTGINTGQIGYCFNPEFLSQGTAVKNTLHPNRIIVGASDSRAEDFLRSLYQEFFGERTPFLTMSIESAEFAKYAANCFLGMKISFANELANVVEEVPNADIGDIMNSIGYDPRINSKFLGAGIGFGGSCFPKDLLAMTRFTEDRLIRTPQLLDAALKINENRQLIIMKILLDHHPDLERKKIAILGITFKPGTNDTRGAPSRRIIAALNRHEADIHIHDPLLDLIDFNDYDGYEMHKHHSWQECVKNAYACLILTEWEEYKTLTLQDLTSQMQMKLVIDGRRIYAQQIVPKGVVYQTIGRGPKSSPITG